MAGVVLDRHNNYIHCSFRHVNMEFGCTPGDLYAGYIVEDSDLEFSDCSGEESSGEDGEEMGHNCIRHGPSGDSDDAFDREMEKELLSKIQLSVSSSVAQATNITQMCEVIANPKEEPSTSTGSPKPKSTAQNSHEVYDELCFDSSESEGEDDQTGSIRYVGKKVCKLSNDELFYDPGLDDEDERWVNRQRMSYHNVKVSRSLEKQKKSKRAWSKPANTGEPFSLNGTEHTTEDNETVNDAAQDLESRLSKSDAVLNCPACMTTLCLDCQRHDQYVNQYRAMFVLNCLIVREETLTYNPKSGKKGQKRRRGKDKGDMTEEHSAYHPVKCHECNTEVAVYDQDEVFHFFNVLASAP